MPADRPTKTPKSVMLLTGPLTRSPRLTLEAELFPRVGLALLHAQADAALVLVDLQHHDFDFLAQGDHLGGSDVLVGPVHLGDVHQAFDAGLDFHERTVVGDVGDLAEQPRAVRVAARTPCQGSSPSCFRPRLTRFFSASNFSTLAVSSWPTVTTSLG
jgi:hypothetical protein